MDVSVFSPAKLNLFLAVTGRRADGFHDLVSVVAPLSFGDELVAKARERRTEDGEQFHLTCDDPAVPVDGSNLVLKAAQAFVAATGWPGGADFSLTKRIPLGGGLGGGSSNAAAVLLALPRLMKKRVPMEKLIELAAGLGSDVPFFLIGGTAVGLGRGTELYPLPDLAPSLGLLITPGIHSSTAVAYAALERKVLPEVSTDMINRFQSVAWGASQEWTNDFEMVVFHQHPQLKSMKGKLLKLGAWRAMMTGSGSALFGLFANREMRDRAAVSMRKELPNNQVYPFSMVSRSRYRALWWRQLAVSAENKTWPPQDRYAR